MNLDSHILDTEEAKVITKNGFSTENHDTEISESVLANSLLSIYTTTTQIKKKQRRRIILVIGMRFHVAIASCIST